MVSQYKRWLKKEIILREQLKSLIHAPSSNDIALVKNTSEALSIVAYGIQWNSGDNIIITDDEFPSNRIVWESLNSRGVNLKSASLRGTRPEQNIIDLIDSNTRLISVSSVQYASGIKLDLKKNSILLKTDEPVINQYYVYSGCLRTYFMDKSGKEHTLQFAIKDWWISDYTAFFSTTKAILNIECIKDATLYKVSRENMEDLYKTFPQLERLFRKKLENAFASFQKRILSNLSQSAQERYLNFMERYPNIEQHIKNYHIASYLGITTESLSRIRKRIASKE